MKLFLLMASLLLIKCTSDDPIDTTELMWIVGGTIADNLEIEKQIRSTDNQTLELNLTTDSLCERNGIQVSIRKGNKEFYSEVISSFPFEKNIEIDKNGIIDKNSW